MNLSGLITTLWGIGIGALFVAFFWFMLSRVGYRND